MTGRTAGRHVATVGSSPRRDRPPPNPAFDVTPARLVTGFITERGVCAANEAGLRSLFPENGAARA